MEESRDGLTSVLTCRCTDCMDSIIFETSTKVKGPRGYSQWESNMASVWVGSDGDRRRSQSPGGDDECDGSSSDDEG